MLPILDNGRRSRSCGSRWRCEPQEMGSARFQIPIIALDFRLRVRPGCPDTPARHCDGTAIRGIPRFRVSKYTGNGVPTSPDWSALSTPNFTLRAHGTLLPGRMSGVDASVQSTHPGTLGFLIALHICRHCTLTVTTPCEKAVVLHYDGIRASCSFHRR
jgi:hypothetical protein